MGSSNREIINNIKSFQYEIASKILAIVLYRGNIEPILILCDCRPAKGKVDCL